MKEDDIYGDLNEDDGDEKSEIDQNIEPYVKHIQSLNEDIAKLCREMVNMKKTESTLKRNLSELFKTAKADLERKDRIIADLRKELDDLKFRRQTNVRNQKPTPRCEKPNAAPIVKDNPQPSTSRESSVQSERDLKRKRSRSKSRPDDQRARRPRFDTQSSRSPNRRSNSKESDWKQHDRYRERDRYRDRDQDRGRYRGQGRDRYMDRDRDRYMDRGRDRNRDHIRDRDSRGQNMHRDRNRERSKDREQNRDRDQERYRDRNRDQTKSREKEIKSEPENVILDEERYRDRNKDQTESREKEIKSESENVILEFEEGATNIIPYSYDRTCQEKSDMPNSIHDINDTVKSELPKSINDINNAPITEEVEEVKFCPTNNESAMNLCVHEAIMVEDEDVKLPLTNNESAMNLTVKTNHSSAKNNNFRQTIKRNEFQDFTVKEEYENDHIDTVIRNNTIDDISIKPDNENNKSEEMDIASTLTHEVMLDCKDECNQDELNVSAELKAMFDNDVDSDREEEEERDKENGKMDIMKTENNQFSQLNHENAHENFEMYDNSASFQDQISRRLSRKTSAPASQKESLPAPGNGRVSDYLLTKYTNKTNTNTQVNNDDGSLPFINTNLFPRMGSIPTLQELNEESKNNVGRQTDEDKNQFQTNDSNISKEEDAVKNSKPNKFQTNDSNISKEENAKTNKNNKEKVVNKKVRKVRRSSEGKKKNSVVKNLSTTFSENAKNCNSSKNKTTTLQEQKLKLFGECSSDDE